VESGNVVVESGNVVGAEEKGVRWESGNVVDTEETMALVFLVSNGGGEGTV